MSLKIMLVDDDPQTLELVKGVLEPMGYETLTFENSKEALKRVDEHKADAIFVGVRMTHLDGFELSQCIRNSRTNGSVPIVMLTASDDADTMRRAFKAGVTFFLGKPLLRAKLRGLMKAIHGVVLNERRRYARLPLRTTVSCHAGSKQFEVGCVDISQTSILLENSGGLGVGQELELEFRVPGNRAVLKPHAKIVRKDPEDRIGLRFTEVMPDDLRTIQGYIDGNLDL